MTANLRRRLLVLSASLVTLVLLGTQLTGALASTAPGLGTASSYAILAGQTATNTGASVITGDVGVSPGTTAPGFPPCVMPCATVSGSVRFPPAADGAKADLTTAYGVAKSSPCNFDKSNQNLGGMTLTPGTYCQTTAPTLTGTLTLSGNGVFIFQAGSTMVTASGAKVVLINGAQACNVFWQVSSSATLGTTTAFVGTIMALTDIGLQTGATLEGRALARNGQVTLDTNRITRPATCQAATVAGPSPTPSSSATPVAGASPRLPRAGAPRPGPVGTSWAPLLAALLGLVSAAAVARAVATRHPD